MPKMRLVFSLPAETRHYIYFFSHSETLLLIESLLPPTLQLLHPHPTTTAKNIRSCCSCSTTEDPCLADDQNGDASQTPARSPSLPLPAPLLSCSPSATTSAPPNPTTAGKPHNPMVKSHPFLLLLLSNF